MLCSIFKQKIKHTSITTWSKIKWEKAFQATTWSQRNMASSSLLQMVWREASVNGATPPQPDYQWQDFNIVSHPKQCEHIEQVQEAAIHCSLSEQGKQVCGTLVSKDNCAVLLLSHWVSASRTIKLYQEKCSCSQSVVTRSDTQLCLYIPGIRI